jgi:hypothetical protein
MIGFCPTSNASAVFFVTLCSGYKLKNRTKQKNLLCTVLPGTKKFQETTVLTLSYSFISNLIHTRYKLICEKKKKSVWQKKSLILLPSAVHTGRLLEQKAKNVRNKDITLTM